MTFDTKKGPEGEPPPRTPLAEDNAPSKTAPRMPAPQGQRKSFPAALTVFIALLIAAVAYFIGRGSAVMPQVTKADTPATEKKEAGAEPAGEKTPDAEAGTITMDAAAAKTAGVKVVSVRSAPFGESLTVPGTVEVSPDRGARITPPVSGKVVSLLVAPGDPVTAGQRLAVLDSAEVAQAHAAIREAASRVAEAKAQVQTAQAGVEQAKTKRESAAATLQRQRELARTGAFSQPTVQVAQNELNTAQSELAQAQTDLQAQSVVVGRNQRLLAAQVVAKAELEQSQVAQQQAQNRTDLAEKRVALAKQALEREQKVLRGGLLNRQAVQTADAEVRAAEGDIRQAQKQQEAAQTALEGARSGLAASKENLRALEGNGHSEEGAGRILLYAPISGTIATRSATIGQAVERSSEIFTIQNLQTVVVEANVPEADVARVRVGAPVTVTVVAYPKAQFTGIVQSIGGSVDEKTRALPMRCQVSNRGGVLRPGMFARVSVATGVKGQALVVPKAAVDTDKDKHFAYVQNGEKYEKRAIEVGRVASGLVEVTRGLKPGEAVVTAGRFVLKSESKKDELKGDED